MSTLVAELLELARLDRTSSLDLTETDLASVVRDAVADAVAVEPGRPVRAEAPPRLVAVVDEPRIRQVLANLLGNVRAHTPVTTPVAVRLGQLTGGVLIEVADAGPGMSAADAARAFDRFHRATDRADDNDHGHDGHSQGAAAGRGPGDAAARRNGGGSWRPGGPASQRDREPARRRQRARPVDRPGDRRRPRRPGDPGILAGTRHPGADLATGPHPILTGSRRSFPASPIPDLVATYRIFRPLKATKSGIGKLNPSIGSPKEDETGAMMMPAHRSGRPPGSAWQPGSVWPAHRSGRLGLAGSSFWPARSGRLIVLAGSVWQPGSAWPAHRSGRLIVLAGSFWPARSGRLGLAGSVWPARSGRLSRAGRMSSPLRRMRPAALRRSGWGRAGARTGNRLRSAHISPAPRLTTRTQRPACRSRSRSGPR
jgi:hypothetical protein